MYRTQSRASYLLGATIGLLLLACGQLAHATILFSDDFQTDASRTTATSDSDPVIGTGDVGGSWVNTEGLALSIQVNNDLTPGDFLNDGTNNYLRIYHPGGVTGRGTPYGTGWDASATLNQVVQFDFLLYRSSAVGYPPGGFRVFLGNGATNGNTNTGANNFANGAIVNNITLDSSNFAADTWVPIQIRVNLNSSLTQLGIAPSTYTWSINGTSQGNFAIDNPGTQIASFLFFQNTSPGDHFNWVDNVVLQTVPEPCSSVIAGLGLIGLTFIGRRRSRQSGEATGD